MLKREDWLIKNKYYAIYGDYRITFHEKGDGSYKYVAWPPKIKNKAHLAIKYCDTAQDARNACWEHSNDQNRN